MSLLCSSLDHSWLVVVLDLLEYQTSKDNSTLRFTLHSTTNLSRLLRPNTDTRQPTATFHSIRNHPFTMSSTTTREHSARVTRARLRDLQHEITLFTNRSNNSGTGSGASNSSGNRAKSLDDSDWLEVLESRIAHLESVVAKICHQAHDCSVYAKAENIERWLSTMMGAHAPKAEKPVLGNR